MKVPSNQWSAISKYLFLFAFSTILFVFCFSAESQQQPKKIPRIGYLSASSASEASPRAEAFRQGMRELGYIEGKNVVIEFRYADGSFDNLPALASELVDLRVDVIVTAGPLSPVLPRTLRLRSQLS